MVGLQGLNFRQRNPRRRPSLFSTKISKMLKRFPTIPWFLGSTADQLPRVKFCLVLSRLWMVFLDCLKSLMGCNQFDFRMLRDFRLRNFLRFQDIINYTKGKQEFRQRSRQFGTKMIITGEFIGFASKVFLFIFPFLINFPFFVDKDGNANSVEDGMQGTYYFLIH